MNLDTIISSTESYVRELFKQRESGHDWLHVERVLKNAEDIAANTQGADLFIIRMAILLHDVPDSKFFDGDEAKGLMLLQEYLDALDIDKDIKDKIVYIVENMSFKHSFHFHGDKDINFQIVQDADRLDAIGAIGIARAFSYGGFKGRPFYDKDSSPKTFSDGAAYVGSNSSTINHFYEKLLLLKDQMNTTAARTIAERRHDFMISFLEEFNDEVFSL